MSGIKNILFDFDGVLAESLEIKTQAFYDMYLPYGKETAEWVRDFHLQNGGVSRFEKFRLYHQRFLQKELSDAEMNALVDDFSARVLQGVIDSDEVPGAGAFLREHQNDYQMFIITGTPTIEIQKILAGRNWQSYFKDVFGSPETKKHWVKLLLDTHVVTPADTVFVGDALTDLEAAESGNIPFILREHAENIPLFEGKKCPRITDISQLQTVLQSFS